MTGDLVSGRELVQGGKHVYTNLNAGTSVLDYRRAMAHKEITAIREADQLPKPSMMLCGPGLYQPTAAKKLKTLESFMEILPYILPDAEAAAQSCMWHNDLHAENIFVDPEDPSQILSIIDWQSVSVTPLFDHTIPPAFLDHDESCSHAMEKPTIPAALSNMSNDEQSIVMRHFYNESLAYAFKVLLQKHIEPAFQALAFQESSAADVLVLARRLFEIGEAHEMSSILALRDEWLEVPLVKRRNNLPFPLTISDAEVAEIEDDLRKAMESQEVMNKIKDSLGELFPEKGIVRHDQYNEAKRQLRQLKVQILQQFARNSQERSAWDTAWPFDD